MWNQQEMKEFMEEAARRGVVPGLENMGRLMAELKDVQERLPIVHVAGTNGKGSVCAMVERVVRKAGYCTGWYSSPAVFSYEEHFRIDGEAIEPERLRELLWEVAGACRRMEEQGGPLPTLFEIETAVAFLCFYQEKCDLVLLETGMGGRLDATNIIKKPLCSVITSVSRDHMRFLGESLSEIAAEKAGIIKEGCQTISAPQKEEVAAVLKNVCRKQGGMLRMVEQKDISRVRNPDPERPALPGEPVRSGRVQCFDYKGYKNLKLSLLGAYQPENAACAIEILERLRLGGYSITQENLRQGLWNVRWPGRFEVVCEAPFTVLDGAHNEDAAKKLRKTLEMDFTNRAKIYIIGVLADKEYQKILEIMLPLAERVFTVTPEGPRALPGEELCQAASRMHPGVVHAGTCKDAWMRAKETAQVLQYAGADPMILVFGSLSYLGDMKQLITGSGERPVPER